MLKVVIAEDDLMIADMAEEMLVKAGYQVCGIARAVPEAVALCQLHEPDLVVIDLRLAEAGLGTEIVPQLDDAARIGVLSGLSKGQRQHLSAVAFLDRRFPRPPLPSENLRSSLSAQAELLRHLRPAFAVGRGNQRVVVR
jgi:CheY-like chemotaxis protein